ncbi:MAG: sulfotransferase family protein [Nocardioides sp.]|uniref:sulfotransferase family protein n=1 Tax=Nocardioides sp. TaxID=35761 RepID=UPI0039E6EDA3
MSAPPEPRPPASPPPLKKLTRVALRRRYYPCQPLGSALYALPECGLVYVKNPKAGCSTLLLWLSRLHSCDDTFAPRDIHRNGLIPPPAEIGWPVVLRMLAGGAYRFTFVRDPLTRLESAYFDKVVKASNPRWRNQVRRSLGQELDGGPRPSFEEFLTAAERQDPVAEMDPHWRPQHINLMHPDVTYDHIGRLESFADDLAVIRSAVGIREIPVTYRNQGTRPTSSVYDDRPDLVRRVRALYAADIELYGY